MKNGRTGVRRLVAIPALVFSIMIIACGCSASRTQSEPPQAAAAAKAKQPSKMQAGAKYVVNIDRAPVSPSKRTIRRYHKARKFNNTGMMLGIEQSLIQTMELVHKGSIVTMESPGPLFSVVRLQDGRAGYIENENLTFLSE